MIYHITNEARWSAALITGTYTHESLETEGFIHCSTKAQIEQTLAKHFKEEKEVYVLHIVDKRIKDLIKIEQLGNAIEPFPHIYGSFEITAVEDVEILNQNEDGSWE